MNAEPAPILALDDARSPTARSTRFATATSRCAPARSARSSARTARASRRSSSCSAASSGPTAARMLVDGEAVDFHSPTDARDAGIAVIYQEPTLFPDLSVAENVVMGRHPRRRAAPDRPAAPCTTGPGSARPPRRPASTPSRPVRGLSIADQQIVEIAKALSFDARVLIMDEPTAALSGAEVERLFAVVRTLRDRGAAVLFISHRLEEVFALCDTVTSCATAQVVHDARTAELTTGRDRAADGRPRARRAVPRRRRPSRRAAVLDVHRLTREGVFTDISFEVRRGRDRRARRPRRRGPQRGRPRDLRHRPRRRRPRRGRRPPPPGQPAARRDARRASASSPRTAASRGS